MLLAIACMAPWAALVVAVATLNAWLHPDRDSLRLDVVASLAGVMVVAILASPIPAAALLQGGVRRRRRSSLVTLAVASILTALSFIVIGATLMRVVGHLQGWSTESLDSYVVWMGYVGGLLLLPLSLLAIPSLLAWQILVLRLRDQ
jgi:hypothetical protein